MKIQPSYLTNNSNTQPTFKGLHVIDTNVQKLLLTSLKPKKLDVLSKLIKEQQQNSVHILLDSNNEKRLNASLMCEYRLRGFRKTKFKQIPILESKLHFIKRVAKIANKYKKQIEDLKVLKLKWDYSSLPEWITKMYL